MADIVDPTFIQRRSADVGRTRRAHKRSALSSCLHSLYPFLEKYNRLDANSARRVSHATARERSACLIRSIRDLHRVPDADGKTYRLRDITNFGNRHMRRLAAIWESRNYSAGTLQKYFSFFRTLAIWIGKRGMVGDASLYLRDRRRALRIRVTTQDKSWCALGVNARERIAKVYTDDPHVGVCLMLQLEFGLRAQEAWLLRAQEALDRSANILIISEGTKNGLARAIKITKTSQREVLLLAASLANKTTGSQIPSRYNLDQWHNHFTYITRKHHISREDGLVTHGLRHQDANDFYETMTGFPSPVRSGGKRPANFDVNADHQARLAVAKRLGHGRKQVSSAYLGSFLRPRNKDTTDTARTKQPDCESGQEQEKNDLSASSRVIQKKETP